MKKTVEKIIKTGVIPTHAPKWAKLDDVQWINKLNNILEHPDKYRNSALKQALIDAAKKVK